MKLFFFGVLISAFAAGCAGSSSSPTFPSPSPSTNLTSVTGSWTGTSSDSTGQEKLVWKVTQTGNSITGTMSFSETGRSMMGNGSMQGTIKGSTMSFHMSVPSGGFSGMMSSCAMSVDGQATMSDDGHTMTGTYSGNMSGMMSGGMMNQSCGGTMNDGKFTLTR